MSNSSPPSTNDQASTERYERYLPILEYVANRDTFEIHEIKSAFGNENPAVVTKLINELIAHGWIVAKSRDQTGLEQIPGRVCREQMAESENQRQSG